MALPTAAQIAGRFASQYESLYHEADPTLSGVIPANKAAGMLARSKLDSATLAKIWDIADRDKRGALDKLGFFVALKLVALAQQGQPVGTSALMVDTPAPRLGRSSAAPSPVPSSGGTPAKLATMTSEERGRYAAIFKSMNPVNGKLAGDAVRPVLLNSGLPSATLATIWELSDMDKDGQLDEHEMCVALHLVYRALEGDTLPSALPTHLARRRRTSSRASDADASFEGVGATATTGGRKTSVPLPPGAVQVLPHSATKTRTGSRSASISSTGADLSALVSMVPTTLSSGTQPTVNGEQPAAVLGVWPIDSAKYDALMFSLDTDGDGLVTGFDCKTVMLQSGLPQAVLAQIWTLVDVRRSGALNREQLALAMHFMEQKRERNLDPPSVLPPELVPPSMRVDSSTKGPLAAEIDSVANEIENLNFSKKDIEASIVQLQADLTVKQAEIKNLEVESKTLTATTQQLDRQKTEANRRLADLELQRAALARTLAEAEAKLATENDMVAEAERELAALRSNEQEREQEVQRANEDLNAVIEEERRIEALLRTERMQFERETATWQQADTKHHQYIKASQEASVHTQNLEALSRQIQTMLQAGDVGALLRRQADLLHVSSAYCVDESLLATPPSTSHSSSVDRLKQTEGTKSPGGGSAGAACTPTSNGPAKEPAGSKPGSKPGTPAAHSAHGSGGPGTPKAGQPAEPPADPFAAATEDPFGGGATAAPIGGADPFGGGAAAPVGGADPFGSGTTAAASDDPFGGTAAFPSARSDDPFGAKPAAAPAGGFADFANFG